MILVCAISFLPESPVWLSSKKNFNKANESRAWLKLETHETNTEKVVETEMYV